MKAHSAYLGTLSPKCSVQVQSASHPKIPARLPVPALVAVNQPRKIPRFPVAPIAKFNPFPAHPMKYYVMQTALASGSKPQLVQWSKSQADAVAYAQSQLNLWRETGVLNPPRYEVHYSGLRGSALWSSLD